VPVLEQVLERNPGQVKVVFKQFPLRSHAFADKAARASIAAHRMGKFWEFHDLLFKHYNKLNDPTIEEVRTLVGLDAEQFRREMASDHAKARVAADVRTGRGAGVRGTPAVYVNGKFLRNRSLKGFQQAISDALKKAGP
jgi:protein-disulfide isomerase